MSRLGSLAFGAQLELLTEQLRRMVQALRHRFYFDFLPAALVVLRPCALRGSRALLVRPSLGRIVFHFAHQEKKTMEDVVFWVEL